MSDATPAREQRIHQRDFRISRPLLYTGLIGSGTAWYLQLLLKYAFTSHSCYPGALPITGHQAGNLGWLVALQYGLDAAALAAAILGAFICYRGWRIFSRQAALPDSAPTEALETADRFFALWGMVYAYLFAVAIIFDFIFVGVLGQCG